MSPHEQFAEDLSLYALGALEGEERANLEKHLETCPACRLELDQVRGDMALMTTAVSGPKPPQRSRQRLLEAIAKEPRGVPAGRTKRKWNAWGALGWVAAALLLVAALQSRR